MSGNKGFAVGDRAILQHAKFNPQFNDFECVITKGLHSKFNGRIGDWVMCYEVDLVLPDGLRANPEPYQLRRKQPPADTSAWFAEKLADLQIYRPELAGEPA